MFFVNFGVCVCVLETCPMTYYKYIYICIYIYIYVPIYIYIYSCFIDVLLMFSQNVSYFLSVSVVSASSLL